MANLSFNCHSYDCSSSTVNKVKQKFPDKLWSVVSDENEDSCIWNSTGDSLLINKGKFTQRFLSKTTGLFRTSKFKSFVRQLNLYGFRKVNKMRRRDYEIWWEYQNELFTRDRPDLLRMIKRKATMEEFYDCDSCSKSRITKRRKALPRSDSAALDLRLALLDVDSDENDCPVNHRRQIGQREVQQREKKESIEDMDLTFSDDESSPVVNEEPFVINIPLSQKQIWDENDSFTTSITFSLFPDLPSSQEADPLIGGNNDSAEMLPSSTKSPIPFNSIYS